MNRFIRLTNVVINTSKIVKIENIDRINTKHYNLYLSNHHISGQIFLYFGSINSQHDIISISKADNPLDYQIVEEWINEMK